MDHIIRRHKSQKQKRVYFTKDTEAAIVKYNNSTDPEERSDCRRSRPDRFLQGKYGAFQGPKDNRVWGVAEDVYRQGPEIQITRSGEGALSLLKGA